MHPATPYMKPVTLLQLDQTSWALKKVDRFMGFEHFKRFSAFYPVSKLQFLADEIFAYVIYSLTAW